MAARPAPIVTLLLLTVLALAVRLNGLDERDGYLSTDEARLALAAEGVLATGLPILPSGRLYTRGLVTIYATAPSLALFGLHDWSARLPSVIAGALLVPAAFLLTRAVAGPIPALAAAAFCIVAGPLVDWSRQAWPPATFLLLYALTAYAAYRGFAQDQPRWQIVAALGFLAALLAYELAVMLPASLGLYLGTRTLRRDLGWWQGRSTLTALAIAGLAVSLLATFGLALRAGTLAGADAEFRHYFTPALRLSGVGYYWRQVWDGALPLVLLVPVGWLWCRVAGRPVPPGLGFLLALLGVALLVPTFVIQTKQEVQYGLAVLPIAAALGAWGIAALSLRRPVRPNADNRPSRASSKPDCVPPAPARKWAGAGSRSIVTAGIATAGIATAGIAVATFGVVLWSDIGIAFRPHVPSRAPTWLDDVRARGWQPDDLVLAEAPLVTQVYLGRADFYIHPEGYERYAYQDGPVARSLYTPAVLLKEAGDFERFVAGPHAGRTLWVIGQDDRLPRLTRQMDPALWQQLQAASGVSRPTRGWWVMRLDLPP